MSDQEREELIQTLREELTHAYRGGDVSRARVVWERLRTAIKGRSRFVVEDMEIAKGLR